MFQFGDLLFYRGDNFFSRVVQSVTNSEYSHVALVIDNLHLAEISWNYKLKIRHLHYRSNSLDVYRYHNLGENQKQLMRQFALAALNTQYDYIQTLGYLVNKLFRTKVVNDPKLFNCSEFISRCYQNAGVYLLANNTDSTVTPADLAKSGLLRKLSI